MSRAEQQHIISIENTVDTGFKCMRLLQNHQETMRLSLVCAKISLQT